MVELNLNPTLFIVLNDIFFLASTLMLGLGLSAAASRITTGAIHRGEGVPAGVLQGGLKAFLAAPNFLKLVVALGTVLPLIVQPIADSGLEFLLREEIGDNWTCVDLSVDSETAWRNVPIPFWGPLRLRQDCFSRQDFIVAEPEQYFRGLIARASQVANGRIVIKNDKESILVGRSLDQEYNGGQLRVGLEDDPLFRMPYRWPLNTSRPAEDVVVEYSDMNEDCNETIAITQKTNDQLRLNESSQVFNEQYLEITGYGWIYTRDETDVSSHINATVNATGFPGVACNLGEDQWERTGMYNCTLSLPAYFSQNITGPASVVESGPFPEWEYEVVGHAHPEECDDLVEQVDISGTLYEHTPLAGHKDEVQTGEDCIVYVRLTCYSPNVLVPPYLCWNPSAIHMAFLKQPVTSQSLMLQYLPTYKSFVEILGQALFIDFFRNFYTFWLAYSLASSGYTECSLRTTRVAISLTWRYVIVAAGIGFVGFIGFLFAKFTPKGLMPESMWHSYCMGQADAGSVEYKCDGSTPVPNEVMIGITHCEYTINDHLGLTAKPAKYSGKPLN